MEGASNNGSPFNPQLPPVEETRANRFIKLNNRANSCWPTVAKVAAVAAMLFVTIAGIGGMISVVPLAASGVFTPLVGIPIVLGILAVTLIALKIIEKAVESKKWKEYGDPGSVRDSLLGDILKTACTTHNWDEFAKIAPHVTNLNLRSLGDPKLVLDTYEDWEASRFSKKDSPKWKEFINDLIEEKKTEKKVIIYDSFYRLNQFRCLLDWVEDGTLPEEEKELIDKFEKDFQQEVKPRMSLFLQTSIKKMEKIIPSPAELDNLKRAPQNIESEDANSLKLLKKLYLKEVISGSFFSPPSLTITKQEVIKLIGMLGTNPKIEYKFNIPPELRHDADVKQALEKQGFQPENESRLVYVKPINQGQTKSI